MNRRGFLTGLTGLLVAPAIVQAASIMPVSVRMNPLTGDALVQDFLEWAMDEMGARFANEQSGFDIMIDGTFIDWHSPEERDRKHAAYDARRGEKDRHFYGRFLDALAAGQA